MVTRMATNMRAPSPPLPPDPSTVRSKDNTAKSDDTAQRRQSAIPPAQQTPDLKRVDSMRSNERGYAQSMVPQQQPITDAVNDAFEHSPATTRMDPDLIKQISDQVIQQVMRAFQQQPAPATANVTAPPPTQSQQNQYPPPPQQQAPRSPNQDSPDSMPQRFTPPSPDPVPYLQSRDDRGLGISSPRSPRSPRSPQRSEGGSSFSRDSKESIRSNESRRSGREAQTPRPIRRESVKEERGSSSSTIRRKNSMKNPESSRRREGESDRDRTPFRRDSKESETSYGGRNETQARDSRAASDAGEATTLEKIWMPLFENGNPTLRLGQFLRGLALHLIDDYEPKGSLIITPPKMHRFFNETKVNDEHYPWDIVFGGSMTDASISMMYRKLVCQHFLVQRPNQHQDLPNVPALTPQGFEWFMTCLIQAHPDTEFERLAKAVMNMPISNADNKMERFPKELSRRLLPAQANLQAEQRMISSLNHEPYVVGDLKGISSMPPPPASAPPPPQQNNSYPERERQPYSHSSQQSNADEEDYSAPSVQIERERKPYTAKEGSGKTYGDDNRSTGSSNASNNGRAARSHSNLPPQAMYQTTSAPSEPMPIPPRNQPQRMSTSQGIPPPGNNNTAYPPPKPNRGRSSPPPRYPYARNSDPNEVGSMPSQPFGSNLQHVQSTPQYTQSNPGFPIDSDDDTRRRYSSRPRTERMESGREDEDNTNGGRGYSIPASQTRRVPIPNNGFEYGGNTAAGDLSGSVPTNTGYPSRPPPPRGNPGLSEKRDRRRSMYGAPPNVGGNGDGGTDGYGSFAAGANGGYPHPSQQK